MKIHVFSCNRKAVAPVIGNILLIAIAVVGGTIIFTFSGGFVSSAQIGGFIPVEALTIEGFDARTSTELQAHDGNMMSANSGGNSNSFKETDERVAIYLRSDSTNKIFITDLIFAGSEYGYVEATSGILGTYSSADIPIGNYTILTRASPDVLLQSEAPEIQPGQSVTIVLDLDSDIKVGRDAQVNIRTSNGNIFVGTINVGKQSG